MDESQARLHHCSSEIGDSVSGGTGFYDLTAGWPLFMEDKVLSKVVLSGTIKERVGKIKFCFVPGRAAVLWLASPELVIRQTMVIFCAPCWCPWQLLYAVFKCLSWEIINLLNISFASIQIQANKHHTLVSPGILGDPCSSLRVFSPPVTSTPVRMPYLYLHLLSVDSHWRLPSRMCIFSCSVVVFQVQVHMVFIQGFRFFFPFLLCFRHRS